MSVVIHPVILTASRIGAAVVGGYVFVWGFIALCAMLAFAAGMAFAEAATLASMLGLLLYLAVFCWAFAAASVVRIWTVLTGSGVAMTLAGWLLSLLLAPRGM